MVRVSPLGSLRVAVVHDFVWGPVGTCGPQSVFGARSQKTEPKDGAYVTLVGFS